MSERMERQFATKDDYRVGDPVRWFNGKEYRIVAITSPAPSKPGPTWITLSRDGENFDIRPDEIPEPWEKPCAHGVYPEAECKDCLADSEAEVAAAEALAPLVPDLRAMADRLSGQWLPDDVRESLERVKAFLERNFPEGE